MNVEVNGVLELLDGRIFQFLGRIGNRLNIKYLPLTN